MTLDDGERLSSSMTNFDNAPSDLVNDDAYVATLHPTVVLGEAVTAFNESP